MKATGVVRRIDDLGRVVIPKEIRRHLRIKEGNSLEIFVNREGDIILKKYSPIEDINEFAQQYTDAMYTSNQKSVLVCDRERIIAVSGNIKKELLDQRISKKLEDLMDKRISKIENNKVKIQVSESIELETKYVIYPIIVNGDCVGATFLISEDEALTDIDISNIRIASSFLGKYLEG